MKLAPLYLLIFLIAACKKNNSDPPPEPSVPKVPAFTKTFGGTNHDQFNAALPTSDGGYILAGNANSNDGDIEHNAGSSDAWIVKIDSLGKLLWQHTYGGTGNEFLFGIAASADGGFIIAGNTNSPEIFNSPFGTTEIGWIFKIDKQGTLQWSKPASTQFGDAYFTSFRASAQGGFLGCGNAYYSDDAWIARFDENGNNTWEKKFETITVTANAIDETSNRDLLVAIETEDVPFGLSYLQITKLGEYGNVKWSKIVGRLAPDLELDILATSDGGSVAVGQTLSTETDSTALTSRLLVVKHDANGNIAFKKWFGTATGQTAYNHSLLEIPNQHYLVAAVSLNIGTMTDIWLLELDNTGKKIKEQFIGSDQHDLLGSVSLLPSGQLFIAGATYDIRAFNETHGAEEAWAFVQEW